MKFVRLSACAAMMLASGATYAQQSAAAPAAAPAAPATQDLVGVDAEWTKLCANDPQSNKEVCYVTRIFGAKADQPFLMLAVIDPKGAPERIIQVRLPLGVPLKPGFRFAVDKGAAEAGAFEVCTPNDGCVGVAKVKSGFVDGMKKGEKLSIIVKNPSGAEATALVPLAGFGKAFDGPAMDPKVAEERQKKLQDELQKKADEERKKMEGAASPGK
jgi:invasion protein IalB